VLVGCVSQVGEQSGTPGRFAWLGAGFPAHVPSTTIERKCGSGQQAIEFANQAIMAGAYRMAIAAGVESMSRVPMGSNRLGQDPFGPSAWARYPGLVRSSGCQASGSTRGAGRSRWGTRWGRQDAG
jgi:acetyl-CoA acyltransferase